MGMGMGYGGWGLAGWVMGLAWLVVVAGLVVLVVWVIQTMTHRPSAAAPADAQATLALRLARGEITVEEYDALRSRLRS